MFRPSLHGWPFRNVYTCTGADLGIGGPPPPALGLGGGLCWAALDRYLRGATIPRDTAAPEPGDALHTELRQRQIAALATVWPRVREWQDRPDGSWRDQLPVPIPLPGRDLASGTRAGWWGLRRRLDAGEPVLLTLIPAAGAYDRPRAVRQVLATGWSRTGLRATLTLYDPDCPGDDDIRLAFNLGGELDARLTGGAGLRGFFPVAYDRATGPTLRTEAFDDRSVIGLKRTIRGRPSPAVGRKHIGLVARNERGALLHFHRADGRHWEGVNVTDAGSFGASELHSDPVAFQRLGTLHAFARSYTGDLLHFRRFRSWSLTNRTEHKRAGARFRLAGQPVPVPGPRLQLSVLGRDSGGGLVHYHGAPLRGWRAEQVPGDPVADDPVAAWIDDTLHAVGVTQNGRVLHWARREAWTLTDTDAGPGPEVRLAGDPTLEVAGDRIRIFGRTRDDALAVLELGDDGVWQRTVIDADLVADPVATTGPGGLHVFAPTTDGGLIHSWHGRDGWEHEDVVGSRPTLEPVARGEADVAAWGSENRLRVFVRRSSGVRAYAWTPDADWVADPVSTRAQDRPVAFRDALGRPHVVFTDGRGTILHVETASWQEPASDQRDQRSQQVEAQTPLQSEQPPQSQQPERAERPERPEPAPAAASPESEEAVPPLPLLDDPQPEEEAEVFDFEMEQRGSAATPGPETSSDPGQDPDLGAAEEPAEEPVRSAAAGLDLEWEPELALTDDDEAEAAASAASSEASSPAPSSPEDPRPDQAEEEKGGPERPREYRWEDRPPPMAPDQVEPMDLSLLDTWPPTRRGRNREGAREKGPDREAS